MRVPLLLFALLAIACGGGDFSSGPTANDATAGAMADEPNAGGSATSSSSGDAGAAVSSSAAGASSDGMGGATSIGGSQPAGETASLGGAGGTPTQAGDGGTTTGGTLAVGGSPAAGGTPTTCEVLTLHRDIDSDGFGDPAVTMDDCIQVGWVVDASDCDDSDPDVHPGQTAYFTFPRAGGSFDFDCNGTEDLQWTELGRCRELDLETCPPPNQWPAGFECDYPLEVTPGAVGWDSVEPPACGVEGFFFESILACPSRGRLQRQACR